MILRAIREPARPSQNRGTEPTLASPLSSACDASRIASADGSINWFVPRTQVIGLSVVVRTVRQGSLSAVVSSCNPPESVITNVAPITSLKKRTFFETRYGRHICDH